MRPPRERDVVVGLGANVDRPLQRLRATVARLAPARVSRLFGTEPWGPPQPEFLNAAVLLRTERSLPELLSQLQALEAEAGRARGAERWGPRPLDLDILWADRERTDGASLQVPHPRLIERPFALRPLLDVAPDAVDPRSGRAYSVLAAELGSAGIRWFSPSPDWLTRDDLVGPRP